MALLDLKYIGKILAATSVVAMMTMSAYADEIEGLWTTEAGSTAEIAPCGEAFCIVLKTGANAGKSIGRLEVDRNAYKGTIIDPADDKEYSGNATVNGGVLKLTGCALVIFCKTQTWHQQ